MKKKVVIKKIIKKDILASLITKKIDLKNLKVPPIFSIDSTKKRLVIFIVNIKKKKRKQN